MPNGTALTVRRNDSHLVPRMQRTVECPKAIGMNTVIIGQQNIKGIAH
jgi:hypothetical protein